MTRLFSWRPSRSWSALGLRLMALLMWSASASHAACPPPEPPVPTVAQVRAWLPTAPDRGLLWRITRGGHSSYLYGTLHIGKPAWAVPGPALRAAWADTEVLAVELDPADVMPALAALPPPAPLPPALARRMAQQTRAACLPPDALARLPAMLQLSTLTLMEVRRDGFDAGFGQDVVLLGWAKAEARPVLSLESVQEQLDALSPGEQEAELLGSSLRQLQQGRVRAPLRKLAAAWSRGDLATLGDYGRWCDCADSPAERAWLARVNDGRNGPLAARITALHGQGQRLLVAVGALHMTGPQALPRLLQAEGFEVEQLVPSR
ncbi:TraB/GumN family protein [Roseateles sp. BYS87W]|uniref:TraB/GumN family protein n=1 Tax=Pelomonas baiyunensis TaxID=3299026 RepID=A0ABW7H0N5_9BURK